jgi:hypothetical protein
VATEVCRDSRIRYTYDGCSLTTHLTLSRGEKAVARENRGNR